MPATAQAGTAGPAAGPPTSVTGIRPVATGDNGTVVSGVIRCVQCGQANRVPAAAAGTPRCGTCHQPLPWIADADDATFGDVADAAKIPVIVDLWAP